MQFLSSASAIASKVGEMIDAQMSGSAIRIAVAFWGSGAESVLASPDKAFQVICNLKTGGSNPWVVRALLMRQHVSMRQLDTLHAKVVVADGGAVVTSSNFSTNGLGLGGASVRTWSEAGVHLPPSASCMPEITQWFAALWSASREITDSDLVEAQAAWLTRTGEAPEFATTVEAEAASLSRELVAVRTVHLQGRAKPGQLHMRSAAAFVVLGGCGGELMPRSAFSFLFSGGTSRAFENHEGKFEFVGDSIRIKSEFIGYFVGPDGTMSLCTDAKRRKSFSPGLVPQVARWMCYQGNRPPELEGIEVEGKFSSLA